MNNIKIAGLIAQIPQVVGIKATRNKQGIRKCVMMHVINDFRCAEVKVIIINAAGKLIEKGNAKRRLTVNVWKYMTLKHHQVIAGAKIIAQVFDVNGNKGEMEITL